MTERTRPFLAVAVWRMAEGYAVTAYSRGPTIQRIGNFHATEEAAREAARFMPRKRLRIGFRDFLKEMEAGDD